VAEAITDMAVRGAPVRRLTLNETFDSFGRLIQMLGTDQPVNPGAKALVFGRGFMTRRPR
jgi:hypothetical protein